MMFSKKNNILRKIVAIFFMTLLLFPYVGVFAQSSDVINADEFAKKMQICKGGFLVNGECVRLVEGVGTVKVNFEFKVEKSKYGAHEFFYSKKRGYHILLRSENRKGFELFTISKGKGVLLDQIQEKRFMDIVAVYENKIFYRIEEERQILMVYDFDKKEVSRVGELISSDSFGSLNSGQFGIAMITSEHIVFKYFWSGNSNSSGTWDVWTYNMKTKRFFKGLNFPNYKKDKNECLPALSTIDGHKGVISVYKPYVESYKNGGKDYKYATTYKELIFYTRGEVGTSLKTDFWRVKINEKAKKLVCEKIKTYGVEDCKKIDGVLGPLYNRMHYITGEYGYKLWLENGGVLAKKDLALDLGCIGNKYGDKDTEDNMMDLIDMLERPKTGFFSTSLNYFRGMDKKNYLYDINPWNRDSFELNVFSLDKEFFDNVKEGEPEPSNPLNPSSPINTKDEANNAISTILNIFDGVVLDIENTDNKTHKCRSLAGLNAIEQCKKSCDEEAQQTCRVCFGGGITLKKVPYLKKHCRSINKEDKEEVNIDGGKYNTIKGDDGMLLINPDTDFIACNGKQVKKIADYFDFSGGFFKDIGTIFSGVWNIIKDVVTTVVELGTSVVKLFFTVVNPTNLREGTITRVADLRNLSVEQIAAINGENGGLFELAGVNINFVTEFKKTICGLNTSEKYAEDCMKKDQRDEVSLYTKAYTVQMLAIGAYWIDWMICAGLVGWSIAFVTKHRGD